MAYRIFDGYTTRDATPEEVAEIEKAQREEQPPEAGADEIVEILTGETP